MCDPATWAYAIGTALSAAATVESVNNQNDRAEEMGEAASDAKKVEDQQINLMEAEAAEKASVRKIAEAEKREEIKGRAKVASGESGAYLNNDAIMQSINREGLRSDQMIGQNLERQRKQFTMDRMGAKSRAQSRINSVATASPSAAGLQIAASGANVAGGHYARK